VARRPPKPGGGGIGRPLGPMGGRGAGGGGTGLPEGLIGGRGAARSVVGAAAATSAGGAAAAAAAAAAAGAGADSGAGAAAGATVSLVTGREAGRGGAVVRATAGVDGSLAGVGAAGGALGAVAGRLLIRRGARASPVLVAGDVEVVVLGAAFDAAVLAAAVEVADELDLTTVFLVAGAGSAAAGAGASGWTSRRSPSASALRRTRSAWASSMEDEWLLTPMPRERASSSPSLLLRPSSLASS
jgi:hypothetical protein